MTNDLILKLIGHAAELADCLSQFNDITHAFWEDHDQSDITDVEEAYKNISIRFGMLTTEYGKLAAQIGQAAQETARALKASEQSNPTIN